MEYDFSSLEAGDFEALARDLIGRELGIRFEAFAAGPDGGMDGRHVSADGTIIIQAKHYRRSDFSALKAKLVKERQSIDRLRAARYILVTTMRITPHRKSILAGIIGPSLQTEGDIYGPEDLRALLRRYPDIELAHQKLWAPTTAVMEKVISRAHAESIAAGHKGKSRRRPRLWQAGLALASVAGLALLGRPYLGADDDVESEPPADSRRLSLRPAGWPRTIRSGSIVDANTPAGTYFQDCSDCPLMVVVPAGRFLMGAAPDDPEAAPNEHPRHLVTFARPFAVAVYETTFDEWDAGVRARRLPGPSGPQSGVAADWGWGRGLRPVINVSFDDASAYAQWLNDRLGQPLYRIPSEAEWEYAARGQATTRFAFGDRFRDDRVAIRQTQTGPVGQFPPNGFGLRDVHGNVWEWTRDCWHDDYRGAPADGTAWSDDGDCAAHALRGGSWGRAPALMRLTSRYRGEGSGRRLGFRVVRELR